MWCQPPQLRLVRRPARERQLNMAQTLETSSGGSQMSRCSAGCLLTLCTNMTMWRHRRMIHLKPVQVTHLLYTSQIVTLISNMSSSGRCSTMARSEKSRVTYMVQSGICGTVCPGSLQVQATRHSPRLKVLLLLEYQRLSYLSSLQKRIACKGLGNRQNRP